MIRVAHLTKHYPGRVAVDDVSFEVGPGEIVGFLGPNGAGKTTTIEVCEGLRRADAGTVRVLGRDPGRHGRQLRERVGVMLQDGGVYGAVTPRTALRHAARLYRHPHPPDALVELLGLGRAARTPFKRLSGGEQQRTLLALALVGRPELVFLDEPTAGLDPQARRAVWELVHQMRRDGVAVVLTTHYLEEAEELADHVVILDHGSVVAEGAPSALMAAGPPALHFSAPARLDVASLTDALPEGSQVSEVAPGRYQVHGPVGPQLLAAVTSWCAQHGVMPEHLETGRRSLEDVFLDLTGRELRP